MMKKFVTAVAALVLSAVWVSAAFAVAGDKGFYYGTEAEQHDLNNVLAHLVRASFAKDPNGNARLSESNCKERGGCGTPRLLVDSFRQMEGLPPVDLSNLAEFLESLEADENRGGYYDVTSLRPDPKALGGFRAVMDGVQRGFNLGEKAWVYHDKKNNRKIVVLMGHCANPVYRLIPITIIGGTPAPVSACPDGWNIHINEWFWSSLSVDLRTEVERLIKAAEARNSRNATSLVAYIADDVSGKLGGRFRREVGTRAYINEEVTVNLRDPETGGLLDNLGSFKVVAGEGDVKLTEAQYAMIVEVIFPGNDIKSPTVSGGQHRLWSRPVERPNTCDTNVHKVDRR